MRGIVDERAGVGVPPRRPVIVLVTRLYGPRIREIHRLVTRMENGPIGSRLWRSLDEESRRHAYAAEKK